MNDMHKQSVLLLESFATCQDLLQENSTLYTHKILRKMVEIYTGSCTKNGCSNTPHST